MSCTGITVKQATLAVVSNSLGRTTFPIHRIYCIGRNYRDHSIEMGHDPDREPPFFFQKPADAAVDTAVTNTVAPLGNSSSSKRCIIPYPPLTSSLHYEAELVVAIGKEALCIEPHEALSHVFGYAVGADLTRRDLQNEAKKTRQALGCRKGV
mmetsp:Transcript_5280/g.10068  ORF Transcript_5280/g.10068 Transcript_5280/m.10068 type:complete len:153 (-) Transcript_5280:338-796(-)